MKDDLDLPEGYRAEVVGGRTVVSPTPTYRHARIVHGVERLITGILPDDLVTLQMVTVENAATGDRYVPDLLVMPIAVADGEGWDGPEWIRPMEAVEFALEVVSPSSALHDWKVKAQGYARSRVPLYLVVDPRLGEIALFSDPDGHDYREVARAVRGGHVRLPEPFGVELAAEGLLG
ncbi:Uma2 family endonuclease [Nocardiopsis protaetiae]|uniref:Uma2 family endonuclease n=1 Tax=Nocardiopsis protaetiae TaxID=3382270 RepID=UPI00387B867A